MNRTERLCVNCDHYRICAKYDLADYNDKVAKNCISFSNYNVLLNMIGRKVYGISRDKIIPIAIESVKFSEKEILLFGTNEKYFGYSNISLDPKNKMGMEWYFTKREAQKVLEEKNRGETNV